MAGSAEGTAKQAGSLLKMVYSIPRPSPDPHPPPFLRRETEQTSFGHRSLLQNSMLRTKDLVDIGGGGFDYSKVLSPNKTGNRANPHESYPTRTTSAIRSRCSGASVSSSGIFFRSAEFSPGVAGSGQRPDTAGPATVGHIARDSTAIPVRERFPETARNKKQKQRQKRSGKKRKPGRPKGRPFARAKASERGTRIQQQRHQKLEKMLADLPRNCDLGVKKSSQGHQQYWRGYKLHLDIADGQVPISAVLSSASLHDSQVAIPLMTQSSQRVDYLYELMDSAYDADTIHDHSRELEHVPIIAPHPRRGTKKPSQLAKIFPPEPTPELSWAQGERFKERTMVERVNGQLKDEFGASHIRVRGGAKVMAHLMFGVLALTVDQWLRLIE